MTNAQASTLVLKDEAGSYYLVSQETLEQGRVPAERAAELEGLLAAATQGSAGEADAHGYALPLAFAFAGVLMGGMAGGIAIHREVSGNSRLAPMLEDVLRRMQQQ